VIRRRAYSAGVAQDLPTEIKRVSKAGLMDLARRGAQLHLSGGRRADWIAEHVREGPKAFVRAVFFEPSPRTCYRTLILAARVDNTYEHFLLDVLPDDFAALPTAGTDELLGLARWALDRVPISPLPPEYVAEWAEWRRR
jgi:hypothetical protein